MERERLRKIEEEKDRQVREKKEAEKRQYQEVIEHKVRKHQLKDSIEYLLHLKQQSKGTRRQEKMEREVVTKQTILLSLLLTTITFFFLFIFISLLHYKLLHLTRDLDIVDSIHALHWTTKYTRSM